MGLIVVERLSAPTVGQRWRSIKRAAPLLAQSGGPATGLAIQGCTNSNINLGISRVVTDPVTIALGVGAR